MLHLPMESPFKVPDVPEYATMIRAGQTYAEVERRVRQAVDEVPGVSSVNNHEGSSATIDAVLMARVMRALKPLGLGFLDSCTVLHSVAWRSARRAGLRWARRDIFLDSDHTTAAIERQFALAVRKAERKGVAIAIGHHHFPATLEVLERKIPQAEAAGIEFVPVSRVLRER